MYNPKNQPPRSGNNFRRNNMFAQTAYISPGIYEYIMQELNASWLINAILAQQMFDIFKVEPFQVWGFIKKN